MAQMPKRVKHRKVQRRRLRGFAHRGNKVSFGDHGLIAGRPRASGGVVGVPWGHLAFGDLKSNWLAKLRPRAMEQARDLLNTLPFSAYEDTFRDCGMQVEAFHVNVSNNPGMKALSILRRLPPLREYCSVSIYSVLRKPPRETA